jgi:hypothetical protein
LEAAVYQSDGSAANIQAIHDTTAVSGDTITLPAGTFHWLTHIEITKGITLQGQTAISGAGTNNPVIADNTVVLDNCDHATNQRGLVIVTLNPTQSFRLTGITFRDGQSNVIMGNNGAIHLTSTGGANRSARIDHCHFDHVYWESNIWITGWMYGVDDHNVFDRNQGFSHVIWHNTWGGHQNGNGSWADFPYYGTEKFWFIEDNTIHGPGGSIDVMNGGRYVARHNYFKDAAPNSHGTEGGPQRGARCREVYNNVINFTKTVSGQQQRSGGSLWHDNSWVGVQTGNHAHTTFALFRAIGAIGNRLRYWGLATGNNPWDMNDPHGLYQSGSSSATLAGGSLRDSQKNWSRNQWAGYSVTNTNPNSVCYRHSSYIISNTSDTITYYFYGYGDRGAPLVFNAGDTYQIHRVRVALDQNGRGKGDLTNADKIYPAWPNEALEPCFSWNNVHTPTGTTYGFDNSLPTQVANRDYYNLGAGFPPNTTPQRVSTTYIAALNGVNYTGPYVYPHPLTQ